MIGRRGARSFLAILILGWATSLCHAAAPAPAVVSLRVGIAAPTVNMLPMWVADAGGLFAAHGLNVEIVDAGGGSRGLAMLRRGALQAMNVGLSAVVDENANGADFRLIASSANTMSFGFFGTRGSTNAAALRGKKIGISTLRSESDIAATPLNEPVNIMAEQRGLPKLVDLTENTPWILNGIVVDRRYLAAHRDTMQEFLRAYTEAIQFALSDPARTEAILTSRFGTLEPRVAAATFADFQRRVPRDAAPSLTAAENMLRTLPQLGTRVASRRVADYVDTAPIDALRREGYFGRLAAKYPPARP